MKTRDEVIKSFDKDVCICDSTILDGEWAAGVVFSNMEKYRIADLLDQAGVQQIMVGIPAMGGDELIAVKHIANMGLDASIMARSPATPHDVEAMLDSEVDSVCLTMPTSDIAIKQKTEQDRTWVLEQTTEAIAVARDHGLYVSVRAEDAGRTDLMFLIEFAKRAKDAGANRLCYYDSIGTEEPNKVYERIESIRRIVGIDMEIHARNDFGLANAVTSMAIKAGARFATTTVMGLGERCGNAALEQVVMTCDKLLSRSTGIDTVKLKPLAEFVSKSSGYEIDPFKPFLGSNCFTYETGMHTDSVQFQNQNDEPYKPTDMGLQRKMLIGKHSGTKAIIITLDNMGIEIKREDANEILIMVRRAVNALHRSITPDELVFIYKQYTNKSDLFDDKGRE